MPCYATIRDLHPFFFFFSYHMCHVTWPNVGTFVSPDTVRSSHVAMEHLPFRNDVPVWNHHFHWGFPSHVYHRIHWTAVVAIVFLVFFHEILISCCSTHGFQRQRHLAWPSSYRQMPLLSAPCSMSRWAVGRSLCGSWSKWKSITWGAADDGRQVEYDYGPPHV